MKLQRWTSCAMGLSVALTLSAPEAQAQDTSQVRIPVRKGVSTVRTQTTTGSSVTRREPGGDVANRMNLRIDSLEAVSSMYRTRLDSLEAAKAASATPNAALEARINALSDSLATARTELASVREELNATNTRGVSTARTQITTGSSVTRRESGGDVANLMILRIDSLEAVSSTYRTRLDSLEAANSASATRNAALEARINALSDSLATARTELAAVREELNATNTRLSDVDTRLQGLNTRFNRFRYRSLFGNSGFYVGLGTGASYTNGTLRNIGYESAPLISMPIGWHKPGSMLGLRTEWTMARLEGVQAGGYFNPDPTVASGVALATVNFPINSGKTNNFYLMGGGGFYMFRDFGPNSALADKFTPSSDNAGKTETKWGFQAGAGLEIHVLGATSLFVQSSLTNVAADRGTVGEEGRNLRWMPVVVGFQLR